MAKSLKNSKLNKKLPKFSTAGMYTDRVVPREGTGYSGAERTVDTGNPIYDKQGSTGTGMNYAALGQAGLQLGSSMTANQELTGREKEKANAAAMNQAADKGIQMIPGFGQYYGMAKGASDAGRSMIGKDEDGLAHSNMEQAADNFMNPTHTSIIDNASKGQHGEALMSAFINPAIGSIAGEVFKGTKFGDKATAYGRGEKVFKYGGAYKLMHPLYDPMHIIKFPNGGNYPEGGNAQLEKQENTLNPDGSTTQFNLPSHEAQNAEEGTVLDPGTLIFSDRLKPKGNKKTFAILNKPNNTDKETKILEDAKSNTLSKKTAELMKNVKHKNSLQLFEEQEALKQSKIQNYIKRLGGKMDMYPDGGFLPINQNPNGSVRQKLGNMTERTIGIGPWKDNKYYNIPTVVNGKQLTEKEAINLFEKEGYHTGVYNTQEEADKGAWSREKANIGLASTQLYPDGGKTDASGFPIDATGRRLSPQEQMGFNRPSNTYSTYTGNLQGNATGNLGVNPNTGTAFTSLQNAGMGTGVKPLVPGGYQQTTPVIQNANESFEQAYQRTYGKPLYKGGGIMPKFEDGDRFVERRPMTMNDMSRDQEDPNMTYTSPWDNPNWINLMKKSPSNEGGNNTNWKDLGYQAGMTLANSAGALTYLGEQGKKYDKQDFYNYNPSLLDPTASLRDIETEGKIAKYDLADKSSGHAGNYLSNRAGLATSIGLAKDKVRREFGNINAQIKNQGEQYNIGNKYMTDDVNARNKGAALSNYYKAINSLGTNVAQSGRDYKSGQRDQESMRMMSDMFANYKYDPKTNSWIFKK